jgi:hypothetical protein
MKKIMHTIGWMAIGAAVFTFACAPTTQYPIHLRYAPEGNVPPASAERLGNVVTVTAFADNRDVSDQKLLGQWVDNDDKVIPFVSSKGNPATNVTRTVETHLSQKGYTVRGEPGGWDLRPETIRPGWGDLVVGGSIEELSVNARAEGIRIIYECKLQLLVGVADVKARKSIYEDTVELSFSYDRVTFSRAFAERKTNKMLTKAVEQALDDMEKE